MRKMAIVPLLAIGASLFLLPDRRPQYKNQIATHSVWNQVNTGPYGARPGITYGVLSHIFPKLYLDRNENIQKSKLNLGLSELPDNFPVTLDVVEQLWTNHPNINWTRQTFAKSLRRRLQLYKYGYVYKDVVALTNDIMASAIIGNTDKWFSLYTTGGPFSKRDFSYSNYPISYSEDDLGPFPAPSMIDPTKSKYKEEFR